MTVGARDGQLGYRSRRTLSCSARTGPSRLQAREELWLDSLHGTRLPVSASRCQLGYYSSGSIWILVWKYNRDIDTGLQHYSRCHELQRKKECSKQVEANAKEIMTEYTIEKMNTGTTCGYDLTLAEECYKLQYSYCYDRKLSE